MARSLSDQFKPIRWEELRPSQRETVRRLPRELLDDVGRPDSDFEDVQDKSYQIIRQLTIEEERFVGKAMASPAFRNLRQRVANPDKGPQCP
jgi:hypothetical protein